MLLQFFNSLRIVSLSSFHFFLLALLVHDRERGHFEQTHLIEIRVVL